MRKIVNELFISNGSSSLSIGKQLEGIQYIDQLFLRDVSPLAGSVSDNAQLKLFHRIGYVWWKIRQADEGVALLFRSIERF